MPKTKTPRAAADVQADLDKVNKQRDDLLEKARKLARELDDAGAYEKAVVAVSDMPEAERAALAQVIAAGGIDATSKVGTPGNEED